MAMGLGAGCRGPGAHARPGAAALAERGERPAPGAAGAAISRATHETRVHLKAGETCARHRLEAIQRVT